MIPLFPGSRQAAAETRPEASPVMHRLKRKHFSPDLLRDRVVSLPWGEREDRSVEESERKTGRWL